MWETYLTECLMGELKNIKNGKLDRYKMSLVEY